MAVPKTAIQSMSTMGVYPSDTYFTENQGYIGLVLILSGPNTTPSANVCEIDTGIDSTAPGFDHVPALRKEEEKES